LLTQPVRGRASLLIFFVVPHLFNPAEGEALSRGESKIRDELSFQASQGFRKKKTGLESPESLASRILRTLDGVPRSGTMRRGTSKKQSPTI